MDDVNEKRIMVTGSHAAIVMDPAIELAARRKIDQLRKEGEMLPPLSRTIYRDNPRKPGGLLPVTRATSKRIEGESGRQRKRRLKLERRELRGE